MVSLMGRLAVARPLSHQEGQQKQNEVLVLVREQNLNDS
jgi:hypothetical protein